MKFKRIKKSGFTKNRNTVFLPLLGLLFLLCFPFAGYSQQFNFEFNNTPVSKALVEISQKANIRIAFDAGELEKLSVSKSIGEGNAMRAIILVLENTNYSVEFKHNTYLVFKLPQGIKQKKQTEKIYSGIVFDKQTGERLPYATIYFWDKNLTISTNVDGNFSVHLPDSATTFLQIKYLGFFSIDTLINTNNLAQFLSFGLSKKTQAIETIDVTGEKLEMVEFSEEAGHFTFNPGRFSELPNYGETDVFRALQLLPGISSSENSSQLNIRGSSADQNLVMFDGFTLYNLDHFFGVFSALNPNVIKNIQVYRGGFDSRYGERVSGIVDITGKSGNQHKPEFYGGINLMSVNLTAEIPISKKLTLVAAGRRAYSDVYSSWFADALLIDKGVQPRKFGGQNVNTIEPKFYFGDYNLKLTYKLNQQENISVSLYGAKDYLNSSNTGFNQRVEIETEDINEWGNYGFGASWKKQWNANYFTNLQFGHSGYFNNYFNQTLLISEIEGNDLPPIFQNEQSNIITNEKNELSDYFVSFQNKYFLNAKNQFEFGISAKRMQSEFYKDATRNFIYNNLTSSAFLYSLFFQDKIIAGNNFIIKPGFRTNFYDKTNQFYIEPRLSASYRTEHGIIFKAATGRYFQYLNKSATEQSYGYNRDFWVLADDELHPVVSSNHFILGASYETKNLFFDVEAYYKTVNGLQEYLFFQNTDQKQNEIPTSVPTQNLSEFISGNGKAYGIDFLAKYESANFTSWLAYSISKATRSFAKINDGENIPASYDQTHELKWTNIYSHKKWNFSTLSIFTTGQPFVEYTEKDEDFNTMRIYKSLPDYFRIDFSVNYNFNIKNVNIKPGLSILNALNTENYLDIYTRSFDFQNNQIDEITLVKAQELTLNFFVNFRF